MPKPSKSNGNRTEGDITQMSTWALEIGFSDRTTRRFAAHTRVCRQHRGSHRLAHIWRSTRWQLPCWQVLNRPTNTQQRLWRQLKKGWYAKCSLAAGGGSRAPAAPADSEWLRWYCWTIFADVERETSRSPTDEFQSSCMESWLVAATAQKFAASDIVVDVPSHCTASGSVDLLYWEAPTATPSQACKLPWRQWRSFLTGTASGAVSFRQRASSRPVSMPSVLCLSATAPPVEPRVHILGDFSKMPIILSFVSLLLWGNDCACRSWLHCVELGKI